MNVHIFGSVCSSAICSNVLRKTASDCGVRSDLVLREIRDHFYVDNWLVSYPTEDEAIDSANSMYEALLSGGDKLTQWASSHARVRSSFPSVTSPAVDLDLNYTPIERTFGLHWDVNKEGFIMLLKIPLLPGQTKNELLRVVASFFDPLGLLCVILLYPKLMLQKI